MESSAGNEDGDQVGKNVLRKAARRVKEEGKRKLS
jgi:hypothetical protein